MADDNTSNAQAHDRSEPNSALASLDVMVGTWDLKGRESGPEGEIHGRVTFVWMEGGFYLVQRVDIDHIGQRIMGVEYVGYDESNGVLKSYFFGTERVLAASAASPSLLIGEPHKQEESR